MSCIILFTLPCWVWHWTPVWFIVTESLWVPENNVYLTLQFKKLKDSVTETKHDMSSETYLQRITMHLLWTWFYGVWCLFKLLHCLPPSLLSFSIFILLSLHLVKFFLILLQHTNHPHFKCVLLRSVLAVCQVVCSHSIMQLNHHPSHTVHYWVLALAQHLIGISAILEPSVSVWVISRTLWKSPSLSCPFWNAPTTWPRDIRGLAGHLSTSYH